MPRKALLILVLVAAALLAVGGYYWLTRDQTPPGPAQDTQAASSPEAPAGCVLDAGGLIGGPIDLVDQNGAPVTQDAFSEGPSLVYFGFTFCPDICPLSLQKEKKILEALGQEGGVIQPILISLDPERDTPKQMDAYVSSEAFPPGLHGLTGSPEQVAAAAKAFKVAFRKEPTPGSAAKYTIGHSSFFYLMSEEWRLLAMFPSDMPAQDAAQCIAAGLQR